MSTRQCLMALAPCGLLVGALLLGPTAAADLARATMLYNQKDLVAARIAFQEVAELGEPRAQYMLGAMLVRGEGGAADAAAGAGWLRAAAENGHSGAQMKFDALLDMAADFTPEQHSTMMDVMQRYGVNGLAQHVIPGPADLKGCPGYRQPEPYQSVRGIYPDAARRYRQDAAVLLRLVVGRNGVPREPEVLAVFPSGVPGSDERQFVVAAVQAALASRFIAATRNGVPVEATAISRVHFKITTGGHLWDEPGVRALRERVQAQNPTAEFIFASAASTDAQEFKVTQAKADEIMVKAAQGGHPRAQYWIAQKLNPASAACGRREKAELWLRAAVRNGEPAAQVAYARALLAGEPAPAVQAEARRLLEAVARSGSTFAARHAVAVLATTPFEAVRDPAIALATAKKLDAGDYADDPQTWEALAAAYAANGRFAEAVHEEQRAIKLADWYRWNTTAMRQRLESYRAKHAWTGDIFIVPQDATPVPLPDGIDPCGDSYAVRLCSIDNFDRAAQGQSRAGTDSPVYTTANTTCTPGYPDEERKAGIEGTTVLMLLVDESGQPLEARIELSSGSPFLDQRAAACALSGGPLAPALQDGKPVRQWRRQSVIWSLGG